ncbi:hypothetical protein QQP08_025010 [Theobroma cacao]|nr:hypothetical protein QQP08_025010 [Theobroma cacao]
MEMMQPLRQIDVWLQAKTYCTTFKQALDASLALKMDGTLFYDQSKCILGSKNRRFQLMKEFCNIHTGLSSFALLCSARSSVYTVNAYKKSNPRKFPASLPPSVKPFYFALSAVAFPFLVF